MAVPFCFVFSSIVLPFKSDLSCFGVKKMGLLQMQRLRGGDEEVREREAAAAHSILG